MLVSLAVVVIAWLLLRQWLHSLPFLVRLMFVGIAWLMLLHSLAGGVWNPMGWMCQALVLAAVLSVAGHTLRRSGR
jgi:hypothetical protein